MSQNLGQEIQEGNRTRRINELRQTYKFLSDAELSELEHIIWNEKTASSLKKKRRFRSYRHEYEERNAQRGNGMWFENPRERDERKFRDQARVEMSRR